MARSRAAVLAVALVAASAAVAAEGTGGGNMDFIRIPLSVNHQVSPGNWVDYDVLKVFANPAFLSYQPRTWAAGVTTQMRNDGDQNMTAVAGGWAGPQSDSGCFGLAAIAAAWSMKAFDEIDVFADRTGNRVSPSGWLAGGAGMFQWKFVSLGGSWRTCAESYGIAGVKDPTGWVVDAGTAFTFGPMVVSGVWKALVHGSYLSAGGGIRLKGKFKGSASAEWNVPMDSSTRAWGGAGLTWNPIPGAGITAGIRMLGAGTMLTFGISAPIRKFTLDYGAAASLGAGLGLSHFAGAGWMNGRERAAPEGPKIFAEEKDLTIAVMNLEAQNTAAGDAAVISDLLRSEIVKQGAFNVVDKTNMERVLNEQAFQQTGCTSAECAVKLGKILNVRFLVVGTFGKALGRYVLSMRVVEVETARIIYTDEAEAADLSEVRAGIKSIAARLTEAVGKK